MRIKRSPLNERGIAHLGLILLALVVVAAGYVAFTRVNSANDTKDSTASSSPKTAEDQDASDAAALNSSDQAAQQASTQAASTQETENVTQ